MKTKKEFFVTIFTLILCGAVCVAVSGLSWATLRVLDSRYPAKPQYICCYEDECYDN